ncbi:MAG TPA: GFA family protein [Polyangiaceae bacterium]|jgi:hypothetical protein
MTEAKTYTGSCHCGRVKYEVKAAIDQVLACNCSMCSRAGTLLAFVPAKDFTLLSGEDSLQNYQFNKHNIHHLFCKVCGVKSFAKGRGRDGSEMRAINVRCLEGVDPLSFEVKHVDGKSF